MTDDHDVVVVGSGFGGSVTALRLAEKGYRVLVLEAGRRFADDEFARTSWDLRRWLWAPRLGCYGIQRIHRLPDVTILAGAGVGGGSLVYANTLYRPDDAFYDDPQWRDVADWRAELAPAFELAGRMLGVTKNPSTTPSDLALRERLYDAGDCVGVVPHSGDAELGHSSDVDRRQSRQRRTQMGWCHEVFSRTRDDGPEDRSTLCRY